MQKNWIRFLQVSITGAMVWAGAPAVFAEEQARENTKQQVYLSQIAKYPALSKEFQQEIETNAHPRTAPSEDENVFLWQLEDYQKLNKEFADTFTQNVATREVPATPEEIYLWQLEEYKELDKEFYHEHRGKF